MMYGRSKVYVEDGVVWLRGTSLGEDVSYEAAMCEDIQSLGRLLGRSTESVDTMLEAADRLTETLA